MSYMSVCVFVRLRLFDMHVFGTPAVMVKKESSALRHSENTDAPHGFTQICTWLPRQLSAGWRQIGRKEVGDVGDLRKWCFSSSVACSTSENDENGSSGALLAPQ